MNISLFVCVVKNKINQIKKNILKIEERLFSLGFDINYEFFLSDLLGLDYKNMGAGLKIILEDDEHRASSLLKSTSKLNSTDDNIFYNFDNNTIIINVKILMSKAFEIFILNELRLKQVVKTLKFFNLDNETLTLFFKEFKQKNDVFEFYICEQLLDAKVLLRFSAEISEIIIQKLIEVIVKSLNKNFYADRDITLSQVIFEILKIRNATFSTAESFTCGGVAHRFISENAGASSIIKEAFVVYSDEAKSEILGVDSNVIKEHTAVSAETAYEMALGLLEKTKRDYALVTTGYANHEDKTLNGLFFTAIGNRDAVHVFQNKYNGTREDVIKYGVNSLYFQFFKKLRENVLNNSSFKV